MKLHELYLTEEKMEVKPAEEVWRDGKEEAGTYFPAAIYLVKKVEGTRPVEHEVYSDIDGRRRLVDTLNSEDLEASYTPVRPNQKEDAEGFTIYREAEEVDAFKYKGDTIKVELEEGGKKKTLRKGSYLLRRENEDSFSYEVQSAGDFEANFTEKK